MLYRGGIVIWFCHQLIGLAPEEKQVSLSEIYKEAEG
jgi:hypothetical protein